MVRPNTISLHMQHQKLSCMIGEPYVQSDEKLIGMPVAVVVDLFLFTNGINGSGLLEMYIL